MSHGVTTEKEVACPSGTTPSTQRSLRAATVRRQRVHRTQHQTFHRDPSGHNGWTATFPSSNSRMSIQRAFAGATVKLGGFDWSPPGVVSARLAEHDGPGSTCPPDKQGTHLRALRSAKACNLGVCGQTRPGNTCPSGRNGLRPAYLRGCNGRGLACPSGATDSDQRTLAGATVGASSTHRACGTHRRAVLRTQRPRNRHVRSDKTNPGL